MNLELPEKWKEWKLTESLGEGSYGEVYRAENALGESCAIKVIEIPKTKEEAESVRREYGDEETVKSFYTSLAEDYEKEIELLDSLKDAENIVRIYDYCREPNGVGWKLFIRMELLQSFAEYCDAHEITEEQVIRFALEICSALAQCESLGIVHRDLKPDNILMDENGKLKLGDFGLARTVGASKGSYSIKGTFSYMAPEVYFGRKYSSQVDIYSLGIILYRLLNRGREPFVPVDKKLLYYKDKENALSRRMNGEKLPDPANATPGMAAIIQKACAYKAEDRYKSAANMKKDLLRLQKGLYKKSRFTHSQKKRFAIIAAVVLLAVIGCAGIVRNQMTSGPHVKFSDDGVLTVYGNKPVTQKEVEQYQDLATSLVIKEGTPSIQRDCFQNFEKVRNVEVPRSLTSIGINAFSNCSSLEKIDLSETRITSIGSFAFSDCNSLKTIDLPEGIKKIKEYSFSQCRSLEDIEIPDQVESIDKYAFEECTSLRSVKIGTKTSYLGELAFYGCESLEKVTGIENVEEFDEDVFAETKWEKDTAENGFFIVNGVLLKYLGEANSVVIPKNVSTIGKCAFLYADSVEKVTIRANVRKIDDRAFYSSFVEDVIFEDPDAIEEIGEDAFSVTPWLARVGQVQIGEFTITNEE